MARTGVVNVRLIEATDSDVDGARIKGGVRKQQRWCRLGLRASEKVSSDKHAIVIWKDSAYWTAGNSQPQTRRSQKEEQQAG